MTQPGQIERMLASLNGQHGILGCLLVNSEGGLVSSSLPPEMDTATLGALSATLFANNDISLQRMNRGNLEQMTLLTDQGVLHFLATGGHYLVVLTAKGERINLEGLIRSVEEQGQALSQLIQSPP